MAVEIKRIKKQPKDIIIIYVEAILMPNGEIISLGKTIGWYEKSKQNLFVPKK